jgi:hypothetical protein
LIQSRQLRPSIRSFQLLRSHLCHRSRQPHRSGLLRQLVQSHRLHPLNQWRRLIQSRPCRQSRQLRLSTRLIQLVRSHLSVLSLRLIQ